MATHEYRRNHYVPEWYQKRFLEADARPKKFFYLDMRPDTVFQNGHQHKRNSLLHWGVNRCFMEQDLYTTKFGPFESTEIEEKFFGKIDSKGKAAVEYFSTFEHPSVNSEAFYDLLRYISTQKLRTPKGLTYLAKATRTHNNKNLLLYHLQYLQDIFCALWSECVWQLVDCRGSNTKFILSDHPVTVYNMGCFPLSSFARKYGDPDISHSGTHTIFPLSEARLLILTNLSWVRHPYGSPMKIRPNPAPFRTAMFNFFDIQTGRSLSEHEVQQVNYVIKMRAHRYIAARNKEWLYPERNLRSRIWSQFGDNYLFMPDPRSVKFLRSTVIGYQDGRGEAYDEYGRQPGQSGYKGEGHAKQEWETFHAFQGEFARKFGPRRRGRSFEVGHSSGEEDSEDYHRYHLGLESKHRKFRFKRS
ncbi:DUF4238 domain-containing protein [Chromobacterium vaccinii]|nr:DUF4238 domain-containing protein [Chromobacterium vaccinii]MBX9355681.1 DUF4238 domain-containing protein [Chromobacterium vaccinii]